MSSVLNVDTIAAKNGTSPVALTKADTVKCAFRTSGTYSGVTASLNVSGLTDNGTGDVTIAFTTSFSNATSQSFGAASGSTAGRMITFTGVGTGSCDFRCHTDAGGDADAQMSSMFTGDLA
jgi:hypothetical protein